MKLPEPEIKKPITQERLLQLFNYDANVGVFIRKKRTSRSTKVGEIAGGHDSNGYIKIDIDGKPYKGHRLAWLYVYGEFPSMALDHKNGIKDDNRICNLREATPSENSRNRPLQANSSSGIKGVYWVEKDRTWHTCCQVSTTKRKYKTFKDLKSAIEHVTRLREESHHDFARHA